MCFATSDWVDEVMHGKPDPEKYSGRMDPAHPLGAFVPGWPTSSYEPEWDRDADEALGYIFQPDWWPPTS